MEAWISTVLVDKAYYEEGGTQAVPGALPGGVSTGTAQVGH